MNFASDGVIKKSGNILRNVKITVLVLALVVVGIFCLGGLFLSSLNNISVLSNNMNSLYRENMLVSLDLKKLETEFYIMRLNVAQMMYTGKYDENAARNVAIQKESMSKKIEEYGKKSLNAQEKALFKNIVDNYQSYTKDTDSMIVQLQSGQAVSQEKIRQLGVYAAQAQKNIDELVVLNAKEAGSVVDEANSLYQTTRKVFIVIAVSLAAIFLAWGISISWLIKGSMAQVNNVLRRLAEYDFTVNPAEEGKNEFAEMNRSLARVIENMKQALKEVKASSEKVTGQSQSMAAASEEMASSSQELATTMQQVAQGATSQAGDLTEIVASLSGLTHNIEKVYDELKNVKDETDTTTERANRGKEEMDKLIAAIEEIRKSFETVVGKITNLTGSVAQISDIVGIITGIAEQTNLLALNAAIEAARAGEHGKGFAVVAEEVRKLAEESRKSAGEITALVASINTDTGEVIKTTGEVEGFIKNQAQSVEQTVESFGGIIESIGNIAPLMQKTYTAMDEIVKSKDLVMARVEQVSAVTEENSAATEEVASSSEELTASSEELASTAQNLASIAEDLMNTVNRFKV